MTDLAHLTPDELLTLALDRLSWIPNRRGIAQELRRRLLAGEKAEAVVKAAGDFVVAWDRGEMIGAATGLDTLRAALAKAASDE